VIRHGTYPALLRTKLCNIRICRASDVPERALVASVCIGSREGYALDESPMYLSIMNDAPLRIFVGSSSEGERYADAATNVLQEVGGLDVTHWRDAFKQGSTFIEDLLTNLSRSDFGIFVFSTDDVLLIRGEEHQAPRDNVVLEWALFTGRLGRDRTFLLCPKGVRVPSDLAGMVVGTYDHEATNPGSAVRPAVKDAALRMKRLGRFSHGQANPQQREESAPVLRPSTPGVLDWATAAQAGVLKAADPDSLRSGDLVVHERYGEGVVTEVSPPIGSGQVASVAFGTFKPVDVLITKLYFPEFLRSSER
jgi:Predicted nucleotide-binding protein containing TIR-like domain